MNKSQLKIFATSSREVLISGIKDKLEKLKIDSPEILPRMYDHGELVEDTSFREGSKKKQRDALIKAVSEKGKEQIIEEIAYTWFNRLIAIYFMETNGYLKYGFNVLPSNNSNKLEPDIVANIHQANILNLDKNKAIELSNAGKFNDLYNYILILICNDLHNQLPFLFERLNDYSELLIPSDLLVEDSIIQNMIKKTDIEDWKEVEIIGWLYQYYIYEKKDILIKAKKKYKDKEDIAAVTQLFTPHWIVKYMVQNSLGRYWVESKSDEKVKQNWDFYIDSRDPNYKSEVKKLENNKLSPEEITVLDPACGSGHILVYAFEVLYEMYKTSGYSLNEIPKLILTKNLFGLEIDTRAGQLSQLSLYLKARAYDENIFSKVSKLNILIIEDSKKFSDEQINILAGNSSKLKDFIEKFIDQFTDADVLGSIIKVRYYDEELLLKAQENLNKSNSLFVSSIREPFQALFEQAKIMNQKFDIVVANPPYMGAKYMNDKLGKYVKDNYPDTKSDLFSVFIEKMLDWTNENGQLGVMSPYVWMFIQTYKKLRELIVSNKNISTLIQLEYNAFENACIPICLFTLRNKYSNFLGEYIKLSNFTGSENQPIKIKESIKDPEVDYRFSANARDFSKIPGSPIAYWVGKATINSFNNATTIEKVACPRVGLQTSDNGRFLRLWHEVDITKIGYGLNGIQEASKSGYKWFPLNKGGDFRKWYGNQNYVINWENNGAEIREFNMILNDSRSSSIGIANTQFYFKSSISWSSISSTNFCVRYFPKGFIFDSAGPSVFINEELLLLYCGFLCSKVSLYFTTILNPTLNYPPGTVAALPITNLKSLFENILVLVRKKVEQSITISKLDWDSRETSWDFEENELIKHKSDDGKIKSSIEKYKKYWTEQFFQLHKNEEELNKIFIEIYGLQDEMTPEVELKDITILNEEISKRDEKNKTIEFDEKTLVKQFISYAVGCIVGRYNLDEKGLAYAGGEFDISKYKTFKVDTDGIIPVLSDDRFDDDIVSRLKEFIRIVFGEKDYSSNVDYIANVLGRKNDETTTNCIRRYFLNDFYKDHIKMYKKRPIYWMFSSGKEKGFNVIAYLHRYKKETISVLRMDYLHRLQRSFDADYSDTERQEKNSPDSGIKLKLQKKLINLNVIIQELKKYDELLRHYADKQIELNLDDGVVVNYLKFKDLLIKI